MCSLGVRLRGLMILTFIGAALAPAPVVSAERDRPGLSLIGAVGGTAAAVAIFRENATQGLVRLK